MCAPVDSPPHPTRYDLEAPTNEQNKGIKSDGNEIAVLPIGDQLLRFLVIMVISWVISFASMSTNAKWTVETYIPWSFWMLHYLVMFGIIGGGWPFAAPLGKFGQSFWSGHGRLPLGLAMTTLTIGLAIGLSAFFTNVYPKYPLFPGGAWFGICLFYVTLWWVLIIQTMPQPLLPSHPFPPVNIAVNLLICTVIALGVFRLVDFEGPASTDASNPKGPFAASTFFGLLVSIIVWVQNFSNLLGFQGQTPMHRLPHPFQHIAVTLSTIGLGVAVYFGLMALGVDSSVYADAIGASQISGSLFHDIAFDFWPYHKLRQPQRGAYSFALSQIVFPFFWVWLCRSMLQPIYDTMVESNPMYGELFTVHTMIPWYSLHVVAPLLLIHQSFFMRWPFAPPRPPLGPKDVGFEVLVTDSAAGSGLIEPEHAGILHVPSSTSLMELCSAGPTITSDRTSLEMQPETTFREGQERAA